MRGVPRLRVKWSNAQHNIFSVYSVSYQAKFRVMQLLVEYLQDINFLKDLNPSPRQVRVPGFLGGVAWPKGCPRHARSPPVSVFDRLCVCSNWLICVCFVFTFYFFVCVKFLAVWWFLSSSLPCIYNGVWCSSGYWWPWWSCIFGLAHDICLLSWFPWSSFLFFL